MSAHGNAWQRSLQAADSAVRLLAEMGVEPTRQIDVFSICEDLGLWLAFMPMDGLLGAFVPEGAGGVLITARRPVTVQRYTAAHELGHWRLEHGHGLALDGEEYVFGTTQVERERLAQVFAASLLMPPTLILSLLARIGIGDDRPVGPREAYFIAREAGVSYEASVRQLGNLRVITAAQVTALLQVRPLTVKSELANGRRPMHGYADVWPVDEAWNDQIVSLRADDEVVVSLPENRSTGYRWMLEEEIVEVTPTPEPPPLMERIADDAGSADVTSFLKAVWAAKPGRAPGAALDRVRGLPSGSASSADSDRALSGGVMIAGDDYSPGRTPTLLPREARGARLAIARGEHAPSGTQRALGPSATGDRGLAGPETDVLIASTGRRLLGLRFVEPGLRTLRLQHRSPYSSTPPVEEYVLHVFVEPHRQGLSIYQVIDEPQDAWINQVGERQLHEPVGVIDDPEQG